MNLPRLHVNAVLLPDRTVLVTAAAPEAGGRAASPAPSRDLRPGHQHLDLMARPRRLPRLYHSVALLLPDGRVVAAGGNPRSGNHVDWDNDPTTRRCGSRSSARPTFQGTASRDRRLPPRNGTTARPSHRLAAGRRIRWAQPDPERRTTHSFNNGQRLVDLPIAARRGAQSR